MSEHLLTERLELYFQKNLAAAEMLSVSDHLAACGFCSLRFRKIASSQVAVRRLREELLAETEEDLEGIVSPAQKTVWWKQLLAALQAAPIAWRVVVSTAAIALAVGGAAIWWRGKKETEKFVVLHASPSPTTSPSPVTPTPTPETPAPKITPTVTPKGNEVKPRNDLVLKDGGGQIQLNEKGELAGLPPLLSPADETLVRDAFLAGKLDVPADLPPLPIAVGQTKGGTNSLTPLAPVGVNTLSVRPTFRWEPVPGAIGYEVSIELKSTRTFFSSPTLSATEWTCNVDLKPGETYRWQVTANLSDKEEPVRSPSVEFQPLAKTKADRISRIKSNYAGWHLIQGTLYANAGLLDEAEQEFQALLNANPEQPFAQTLLRRVKALRRR